MLIFSPSRLAKSRGQHADEAIGSGVGARRPHNQVGNRPGNSAAHAALSGATFERYRVGFERLDSAGRYPANPRHGRMAEAAIKDYSDRAILRRQIPKSLVADHGEHVSGRTT
jgi:hypothetical protein